jgi:hypothetical protein
MHFVTFLLTPSACEIVHLNQPFSSEISRTSPNFWEIVRAYRRKTLHYLYEVTMCWSSIPKSATSPYFVEHMYLIVWR